MEGYPLPPLATMQKERAPHTDKLSEKDQELFALCQRELPPQMFSEAIRQLGLEAAFIDGTIDLDILQKKVGTFGPEYNKSSIKHHIDTFVASAMYSFFGVEKKIDEARLLLRQERKSLEEKAKNDPSLSALLDSDTEWSADYSDRNLHTDGEKQISTGKDKLQCLINCKRSKTPSEFAALLEENRSIVEFFNYEERDAHGIVRGNTLEEVLRALKKPNTNWEIVKGDLKDDPRATPVGKILRRKMMDEFPQILDVIKGNEGLVGMRSMSGRAFNEFVQRAKLGEEPYAALYQMQLDGDVGFAMLGDLYCTINGVENRNQVVEKNRMLLSWMSARFMNRSTHMYIIAEVGKAFGIDPIIRKGHKLFSRFMEYMPKERQEASSPTPEYLHTPSGD